MQGLAVKALGRDPGDLGLTTGTVTHSLFDSGQITDPLQALVPQEIILCVSVLSI